MRILLAIIFFVFVLAGGIWVYQNTDAPFWCDPSWMKYDRSCSGWILFGD